MGKKRIIVKTEEELLKEREKIDQALKREIRVEPSRKVKEVFFKLPREIKA